MSNLSVPNPDYGRGRYRRAIHLVNYPDRVEAALEDTNHGFTLVLHHDGECITAIEGLTRRAPLSTCVDAPTALAKLKGFPLRGEAGRWRRQADPSSQCTHLFDLASLALAHASRDTAERRYDVVVEDAQAGVLKMSVSCDGHQVLAWTAREDNTLIAPDELAGRPVMQGFHAWASAAFSDDALEAAQVLQRGYFVANARRYDMSASVGQPAAGNGMPAVCYSYSEPRVSHAVQMPNTVRDFSDCPEQLLRFQ